MRTFLIAGLVMMGLWKPTPQEHIFDWVAERVGVPAQPYPSVHHFPSSTLCHLTGVADNCTTRGLYIPSTNVLLVAKGMSAGDEEEVIAHEATHYYQWLRDPNSDYKTCAGRVAMEAEAYANGEAWARLRGFQPFAATRQWIRDAYCNESR